MIYWIQYRNQVERTDKNFKPLINQDESVNENETQTLRHFQKCYLFSLIPITPKFTQGYQIIKGDKSIFLDMENFKLFKSKFNDSEQLFDYYNRATETKKEPLSYKGLNFLRSAASIGLAVCFLATLAIAAFTLTDKNFSNERKTITNANQLKSGDYVEVDTIFIDSYQITTQRTSKGRMTESKSNLYSMGLISDKSKAFDATGPFLIRSAATSQLTNDLDKTFNVANPSQLPLLTRKIQGEVKPVSQIEKLSQSQQVTDYFKVTTDELELGEAEYFIDTKVEQVNFFQAALPTFIAFTLMVMSGVVFLVIGGQIRNKIKTYYNL